MHFQAVKYVVELGSTCLYIFCSQILWAVISIQNALQTAIKAHIWSANAGKPDELGKDVDIEEVDGVVENPSPRLRRRPENWLSRSSTAEEDVTCIYCKKRFFRQKALWMHTLATVAEGQSREKS